MRLAFNKVGGLVAAVVQDASSGRVLMVAYRSPAAFEKTVATGRVTFFGRSRDQTVDQGRNLGAHAGGKWLERQRACKEYRQKVLEGLGSLCPEFNGDQERTLPHVVNLSFPGLDSEAVMVALKGLVAVSNGSACTSQNYQPSHVLKAMGLPDSRVKGAVRISWCHMTEDVDWDEVVQRVKALH